MTDIAIAHKDAYQASAQIAEQPVIGVVTGNFHVRSIYSKLGINSRSAATRYPLEHHLV